MGFGFTTARNAVPDARQLSTALLESLDELVRRSRPAAPRKTARSKGARRVAGASARALPAG